MTEPTSATVCVGSCNREWKRAEQRKFTTGVGHELHPVMGVPWWCEADGRRIGSALLELVELYVALDGDKGSRTSNKTAPTTGSRERPSASAQVDAQDEMVRMLMHWEDSVREARRMSLRVGAKAGVANVRGEHVGLGFRQPEDRTLVAAVGFLAGNLGWILAADRAAAITFGQAILNARSRYQRLTGAGGGSTHKAMPCPSCDWKSLVQRNGSDTVGCDHCGRILTLAEYDAAAKAITGRISA